MLAIFIACIGLLGLAAYATQQRTREISVRKVLGAGVGNIVTMLSKDFLRLVIIATVIAFPVAWWMMHSWLENFEYRTNLECMGLRYCGFVSACYCAFNNQLPGH